MSNIDSVVDSLFNHGGSEIEELSRGTMPLPSFPEEKAATALADLTLTRTQPLQIWSGESQDSSIPHFPDPFESVNLYEPSTSHTVLSDLSCAGAAHASAWACLNTRDSKPSSEEDPSPLESYEEERWRSAVNRDGQTSGQSSGSGSQAVSPVSPCEASSSPRNSKSRASPKAEKPDRRASYWTKEEHELFLIGLQKFANRAPDDGTSQHPLVGLGPGVAELISAFLGSRTVAQVRSHAQKHFIKQWKEKEGR